MTPTAAPSPVNILLVDDRPENLIAMQAILDDARYRLVAVQSGEHALEAVLDEDFAVILLDVAMPQMDGFATARLIKQRPSYAHVPIIFITASIYDVDNIYRGYACGAVDYLSKPVSPEIVRAKVAVFAQMYQQREQIRRQSQLLAESARRERELLTMRAEAALSASEAQYEATARQAPFGIALVQFDGQWLRVNQSLCDMLGYKRHALPLLFNVVDPEHGESVRMALTHIRDGNLDTFRREIRFIHRNSGGVWVNATFSRLEGNAPDRMAVVMEDISERKWQEQWQQVLSRASEALLSSLDYQITLPQVASLTVPDVASWCTMEVVSQEEQASTDIATVFDNDAQRAGVVPLRALIRKQREGNNGPQRHTTLISTISRRWLAQHCDGEIPETLLGVQGSSLISVPMLARGRILGTITLGLIQPNRAYHTADLLMVKDLANRCAFAIENARLYEEAQQAVRIRDDFLSVASHELRTPLTPLRLQLQRLTGTRTRAPANLPSDRVRDILQRSERHVQRLGLLIDNLLDVSRITSGRLSLELESLDLAQLTREVAGRFSEEFTNSGSVLRLDLQGPAIGRWDRLRLEQVITNLLSNAIKYGVGKPIEVTVRAERDKVVLAVQDHGIGIAADKQEQIFERFERAVPTRSYGGLGLGLFIARQILDAHGGSIRVMSEMNVGTLFTVELPAEPVTIRTTPATRDQANCDGTPPIH